MFRLVPVSDPFSLVEANACSTLVLSNQSSVCTESPLPALSALNWSLTPSPIPIASSAQSSNQSLNQCFNQCFNQSLNQNQSRPTPPLHLPAHCFIHDAPVAAVGVAGVLGIARATATQPAHVAVHSRSEFRAAAATATGAACQLAPASPHFVRLCSGDL